MRQQIHKLIIPITNIIHHHIIPINNLIKIIIILIKINNKIKHPKLHLTMINKINMIVNVIDMIMEQMINIKIITYPLLFKILKFLQLKIIIINLLKSILPQNIMINITNHNIMTINLILSTLHQNIKIALNKIIIKPLLFTRIMMIKQFLTFKIIIIKNNLMIIKLLLPTLPKNIKKLLIKIIIKPLMFTKITMIIHLF